MKSNLLLFVISILGLWMVCPQVFAHHGTPGSYDQTKTITIKGTITSFVWRNPHVQIYFDSTDDKGNLVHWGGETNSPNVLGRGGWTRTSLKPGDEVTITLHPSLAGAPVGEFVSLVMADGRVLNRGNGGARADQ
jgi:hypothetical protein